MQENDYLIKLAGVSTSSTMCQYILVEMNSRTMTQTEMIERFTLPQAKVSAYMKRLKDQDVVEYKRIGKDRGHYILKEPYNCKLSEGLKKELDAIFSIRKKLKPNAIRVLFVLLTGLALAQVELVRKYHLSRTGVSVAIKDLQELHMVKSIQREDLITYQYDKAWKERGL